MVKYSRPYEHHWRTFPPGTYVPTPLESMPTLDRRHALSCKKSVGRHQHHAAINDIIKPGLISAHISSRLEPTGLMRSDGKRPDGATLTPWKSEYLLVWEATCPDTLAASYRTHATSM